MTRLWALKGIQAGLLLALMSLLVAREYLRAVPMPRRPGLRVEADPEPALPSRWATGVGYAYLAAAAIGLLIALIGALIGVLLA